MVMVAVTSIYGLDPWVHDFYLLNSSIIIIFFWLMNIYGTLKLNYL